MALISSIAKSFNRLTGFRVARAYINHQLQRYGEMTTLKIDPASKTMEFEVMLKGETSPIRVNVSGYELKTVAGETVLRVGEVTASREWIAVLSEEFLKDRTIPLPEKAAKMLKLVL